MLEFLTQIFAGPFIPHGHCYLWKPELVWLHVASDSLTALAYYSIPVLLIYFAQKRREILYSRMLLLFGLFIAACGTTHALEVWTLWHPSYWLSGFVKALTAAVSTYTAIELVQWMPGAIAQPTTAQLAEANHQLETEIRDRAAAQFQLQQSQARFPKLAANLPGLIYQFQMSSDGLFSCPYISAGCREFCELEPEVIVGDVNRLIALIHPDDRQGWQRSLAVSAESLQPWQWQGRMLTPSGCLKWLQWEARAERLAGGDILWDGLAIDISEIQERKRTEAELLYRLEFENSIATLSTNFINLAADEIDSAINQALENIGQFLDVDRCYVYLLADGEETHLENTHEWRSPEFPPTIVPTKKASVDKFAWTMSVLRRFETICVSRAADLPAEAAVEKELMAKNGIQSFLVVPIVYGRSLIGSLGFYSVRSQKNWSADSIRLLRLASEIFANAIQRQRLDRDRLAAQQALQRSEERFRATFEQAAVGIGNVLKNGRWLRVNQKLCDIVGYAREELLELTWQEITHPDDLAVDLEKARSLFGGEISSYSLEKRCLRKDGSPVWINLTVSLMEESEGEPYMIRVVEDISDRVRAEECLRLSEERFRFLAEFMPQMVWTAQPDGWVDYYNQRWYDYTGTSFEEMQGWGWQLVLHPDDRQPCLETWNRAVKTGESYEIEYRYKKASDGQYRWHLGRALPMRDAKGEIIKWFGTCTDIDDRKRTEEAAKFLASASNLLASSLDYETTLSILARLAIPTLADYCLIDMVEAPAQLRLVEVSHRNPINEKLARAIEKHYPLDLYGASPRAKVLRSQQPELVSEVSDELLQSIAQNAEHLEILRSLGWKSCMSVPAIARGRLLGAISFFTAESQRRYRESDLALAEDLVRRAAAAIDNALLYRAVREAEQRKDEAIYALEQHVQMLDLANDSIIICDLDGAIAYWNQGAEREYGWRKAEAIGKNIHALLQTIFPQPIEEIKAICRQVGHWEGELIHAKRSGEQITVLSRWTLLRYANGSPKAILEINSDISDRKQSEAALEAERQLLRQIVTHAPVAMAMFDTQMRYLAYSNKWAIDCKLVDFNKQGDRAGTPAENSALSTQHSALTTFPHSLIGCSHYDILPDIPQRWKDIYQRALQGDRFSADEEIWERADGSRVYLRWAIHPWYDSDGSVGGVAIALLPIDELVAAREAALEASRIKSRFLANMSHEIRTPMNGVLGMAELLLKTKLTAQQREFALVIRNSANHLLTLINDILDFSKLEAGEMQLEQVKFDLNECLEAVIDVLSPQAEIKKLELVTFSDRSVPAKLQGDPVRLRQVLLNLTSNAIKFTDAGDVTISVTACKMQGLTGNEDESTQRAIALRFCVKDTGIGISPEGQQKLFQSFSQVDASTTRQYGGTGLGLAICRQLIELMGGEIGVESELNFGSTFWFTANFSLPENREGETNAHPSESLLASRKLLLVSSHDATRKLVTQLTRAWGMEVVEISDISDIRRAPLSPACDVAIADFALSAEFIREMRSRRELAEMPLILLLWMNQREEAIELLQREGLQATYLFKPLRYSRLLSSLLSALGGQDEASVVAREKQAIADSEIIAQANQKRNNLKILVVEDNAINQQVILNQLETLGYGADCADNGAAALTMLSKTTYNLVFMDCQMPVMDGYETTRELRRREQSAPEAAELPTRRTTVIALTANAFPEEREKCLQSGMDDYISKPISLNDLQARLQRWAPQSVGADVPENTSVQPTTPAQNPPPAETATADSDVPVNVKRLQEITRGKVAVQQRLLEAFLKAATDDLELLRDAIAAGDCPTVEQKAHRFKGSSANMGVPAMSAIAATLERQAREKNLSQAAELFADLETNLMKVRDFVQSYFTD